MTDEEVTPIRIRDIEDRLRLIERSIHLLQQQATWPMPRAGTEGT